MEKWRSFLKTQGPRRDLQQSFFPEQNEDYRPALINTNATLNAVLVAARLLHVVATRGGTRVKPALIEKVIRTLENCLPAEAVHHTEDEVTRILAWLDGISDTVPITPVRSSTPELDMMYAADLESRISVAEFALREGFDLELEYYDGDCEIWPRLRAAPVEILEELADEEGPCLVVLDESDQRHEIPIQALRWLMPVTKVVREQPPESNKGRLLQFPGRDD
ncbi:MAG: hypothetical protein ACNA8W_13140 [Bradymonadaceae bacterium]